MLLARFPEQRVSPVVHLVTLRFVTRQRPDRERFDDGSAGVADAAA
jgi:hypothetical protein